MSGAAGTGPASPVAGRRTAEIANPLFEYLLRLGDDRLVLGHRLSEWCGHGPILEEDIAMANIALDLVGQASALLKLAGETEGAGRDEDTLAYFRGEPEFRNVQLAELPKGDFAFTIVRQFLFDAYSLPLWTALERCTFAPLAAIAAKARKEDTYHLRHTGDWVLRLGDGTDESHTRAQAALDELWRFTGELFESDAVDADVRGRGVAVDLAAIRTEWERTVGEVVRRATLTLPPPGPPVTGGRRGRHTEFLGHMLAEMQIVARSHPGAKW
ncbi:MAG TPA: 1,2-phenylacetyl-CoA epoxidase subunit PaaC [Gemmatimonadaceae bacterium]|nr:1,2-phenylacetyl-CoA epoxidase subunit PaaC [Gemmatimonadaceae bacterium]